MTNPNAGEILKMEYGTARNFMTPNVLEIGMIANNQNNCIAFELSTGRGIFEGTQLFGVSVVEYDLITKKTDRHAVKSECFHSLIDANDYIKILKEKYDE